MENPSSKERAIQIVVDQDITKDSPAAYPVKNMINSVPHLTQCNPVSNRPGVYNPVLEHTRRLSLSASEVSASYMGMVGTSSSIICIFYTEN